MNKNKKLFYFFISLTLIFGVLMLNKIHKLNKYKYEWNNISVEDKEVIVNVINLAKEKVGLEYVWGGKGEIMTDKRLDELIGYYTDEYYPLDREDYIGKQAFDCSGLTHWIYKEVTGINIGYSTYEQEDVLQGYEVNKKDIIPGDLIYTPGHVVLYIGDGKIINAYNKYAYPVGGVKYGKLKFTKDSVIYRPMEYINSLKN